MLNYEEGNEECDTDVRILVFLFVTHSVKLEWKIERR